MARLPRWQIESWIRYAAVGWLCGTSLAAPPRRATDLDSLGHELVTAVQQGNVSQTTTLLARWRTTGKPWPLGPDKQPLLFLAIEGREKSHPEIVELLFSKGATLETRGAQGMTALHWAAAKGYSERTEQILRHHPKLEAIDDRGRTPLLVAHSEAAEKLLAAGANFMAMDKDGLNALHYAAQEGARHLECIWRAGFKVVDARSNAGLTPLHIAAVEGTESAVRWLLDHGADVNAVTAAPYSYLPRYLAPGYGYEIHLPRGATPLQLASTQHENKWSSGRYRPVIELLRARGGTGASLFPGAATPLVIAASLTLVPFGAAFFAGLLFLDARVTGWHRLAKKFPAAAEPANVYRRQNGGVGAVGLNPTARSDARGGRSTRPLSCLSAIPPRRSCAASDSMVGVAPGE
jgi:hypothetical protein